MEVQDGFVLGIYNYCDRWCETCAFTSRCRVFADIAEMQAAADANLEAVVNAPPLPQDMPPPAPRWLQECIDEMNQVAREAAASGRPLDRPEVAPEHRVIEQNARDYCFGVAGWLQTIEAPPEQDHADPRSVILWFCAFIPPKVYRALTGLVEWQADPGEWPPDHEGSAKIALIAIDRSRAAWVDLVDRGLARIEDAGPRVSELGKLADDLERVFPNARAFVRPGFDEPDEVAKLSA